MIFRRISPIASVLVTLLTVNASAAPNTNPDSYNVSEDGALSVADAGVLTNDSAVGSLSAALESDVSNGTLSFNADGSFTYTPDPDFTGTDTFTYRAIESAGAQQFTVNTAASTATVSATLATALGTDSDSANTQLQGTLEALVTPTEAPFSQIHITDLQIAVADEVTLTFVVVPIFASVVVEMNDIDSERITIEMVQPGASSPVDASGNFSQLQNEVRAFGTINPRGTGLAAGQVPEGPQVFDEGGFFIDLEGALTQNGNTLTLNIPVEFEGAFDLEGNTVDLDLTGTVVATSPVQSAEVSDPVTVTITVTNTNDPPSAQHDPYFVAAGSSLVVPATLPGGGDEVLVDTGAIWSYLDDGSDQGSAWIDPEFDDAAWASGPSQLGYGDSETTEVSFGGVTADKHITTYFRHDFSVPDPELQGELTIELKRDDGAAVYLNGVEVVRSNLAAAAGSGDLATSTVDASAEGHYFSFQVPASLLVAGANSLAVEVHQGAAASSDLIFDLRLIRNRSGGGVLANDEDIDGDQLSATVHTPPANGSLSLAADGSFTYTPNPGFAGRDTFVYEVSDGNGLVETELIPFGDRWRFLDDGSNQGTAWFGPTFDDSSWSSGPGELGYGEDDQATTLGFGADGNNKFATTYFRNEFYIGNLAELSDDVFFQMVRDDAAAVYVNGMQVYRDPNLPAGALFNTYASSGVVDENEIVSRSILKSSLVEGRNTVAVEVHQSSGTSSDLAFEMAILCESQSEGPIVAPGAVWKYEDSGADLGTAWRDLGFDDSLWLSGAGELGYGDGDEATALPDPTDPKPLTVYFRHAFEVADASRVQTLAVELVRDDGIAVYLNGSEIVRDNLDPGADFDTPAASSVSGDSETKLRRFVKIDPSLLQDGENILSAEVHQVSVTSSDLSFDLRLNASSIAALGVATIDVIGVAFVDTDNDGMDDNWETANGLVVGVDDSAGDDDGDRRSNLDEFLALTDPQDGRSQLQILTVEQAANGDLTVTFSSTPGKTYQLQEAADLGGFSDVAGAVLTASGEELSFTTSALAPDATYLRVIVQ